MNKYTPFEWVKRLRLNRQYNLWSFVTLRGLYITLLKVMGGDREYRYEKLRLLEEICDKFKDADLQRARKYLNEVKDALHANEYNIKLCRIRGLGRVVIGTNEDLGKIPFEVGLFFDPVLNVPFIPGSSLKGAFRHALEELVYRDLAYKGVDKEEARGRASEAASIVFGSNEWAGLVGVTDAYPVKPGVNDLLLEPDVVTPHYPEARTELDVKPNPVPFLSIARGVEFEFYIYFNKRVYEEEHKRLGRSSKRVRARLGTVPKLELIRHATTVEEYVKYALHDGDLAEEIKRYNGASEFVELLPWIDRAILYAFVKGVGAKTSIGYSRFIVVEYKTARR